ncbi:MAG: hypothetical protein PHX08_14740 [Lachnospiraceae bacterium]|nr:hypothetical protein [Lachnospiraceae bacterium]
MKKKLLAIILAGTMILSLSACGGSGDAKNSTSTKSDAATETTKEAEPEAETTYQSILDEYTQKITDGVPGLIDEYNAEAADKTGDMNALAELSNAKVSKLAEICNEGVEQMAQLKIKNGDDDTTYTDWAGKLQAVYSEQAKPIQDAYMNSATQ